MSIAMPIERYVERLSSATDLDSIYSIINEQVNSLGFEKFTYHVIRPPEGPRERFYRSTYPESWVAHYLDQEYVNIDPIAPAASSTILPFSWSELRRSRQANSKWEMFFSEAGEFGLAHGVTIPLHGPGQCLATFNMVANPSARDFEDCWETNRHFLHLAALYGQQVIVECALSDAKKMVTVLSPRERECLLWSSRGKTAWEISEILSLSQDTVTEYIRSAARKLGVYSKMHAVVKAILLGIIVP